MKIDENELQAVIKKAVSEKMNELAKKAAEEKAAAAEATLPHELTLENVFRFSGTLPETPYTRDTVRGILNETIQELEEFYHGGRRLNGDILPYFLSKLDREIREPTTKEQYQERRAAMEAEYERQKEAETAIAF